jgi:WD40 repeat protein
MNTTVSSTVLHSIQTVHASRLPAQTRSFVSGTSGNGSRHLHVGASPSAAFPALLAVAPCQFNSQERLALMRSHRSTLSCQPTRCFEVPKLTKSCNYRSNQLIQSYSAHNGAVTRIAWHPSGNFMLTASLDSTLKIWDVREGQLFYTLHGHEGAVYDCCFSPAGDFFASAGCDEQVWTPEKLVTAASRTMPMCPTCAQCGFHPCFSHAS